MLEELRRHNVIVQERIMKSFGYADTEDFIQKGEDEVELIQKGEIDYDWELEKAVYADTPQNRRLNRVGQEYHRGKGKKEEKNDMRNADGRMNKNSKLVQRMWSLQHKVDDGKASDEERKEYATLRGMAIGKSKEEAIKEYEERFQKTKEKKDHLSGRRTKEERLGNGAIMVENGKHKYYRSFPYATKSEFLRELKSDLKKTGEKFDPSKLTSNKQVGYDHITRNEYTYTISGNRGDEEKEYHSYSMKRNEKTDPLYEKYRKQGLSSQEAQRKAFKEAGYPEEG